MIDAYRLVKQTHPEVQLALVGSMAHDDPEGWDYYNRTVAHAAGDPDIFILSNLNNIGSVEVNAFQVHSAAVIQKSIREGFGLTVTEALVEGAARRSAGRAGGIVAQIRDGETGLARRFARRVRRRVSRDPRRPVCGVGARTAREGGRPPALPDAAPAARLAGALQPPRRERARRDRPRHRRHDCLGALGR